MNKPTRERGKRKWKHPSDKVVFSLKDKGDALARGQPKNIKVGVFSHGGARVRLCSAPTRSADLRIHLSPISFSCPDRPDPPKNPEYLRPFPSLLYRFELIKWS
jgi:hypothetical protein